MILSDRDIVARLEARSLVIDPLRDPDKQIQPASVDLRLDPRVIRHSPSQAPFDPKDPASLEQALLKETTNLDTGFLLKPGEFALGCTAERVKLPHDLVAQVDGRSSIGRLGILVHITAGYIDPGFDGQITLEFANVGTRPVRLYPGMRVCQLVLIQMSSAADRAYGNQRASHYQNQEGPVPSRLSLDD